MSDKTTFADLGLPPEILKAVAEAGYEHPTPIQEKAIPAALEGRDVLGIAQTGTGKTAAFTLPMITMLQRGRAKARMPRSLVLAPTRELAAQVAENFDTYTKYTRLTKALLIGGVSFKDQDRLIDRGVDVLIATPGRLLDHFERGKLLLTGVQIMVVDEADRMLDMGFIPDLERIFKLTPFTRQTLFFSATMPPEIQRITNEFLFNPVRIEVARQATTGENIAQRLVEIVPSRRDRAFAEKRAVLRALIREEGDGLKNAIIFANRKADVDVIARSLKKHGLDAAPIHGDLDQSLRMKTLDAFRSGELRFLVASDVAARGLDIPAVSHVFNFDVPTHAEDYVHRIGRTGRAGRKGTAYTLATPADEKYVAAIERMIGQPIPRHPNPLEKKRPATGRERAEDAAPTEAKPAPESEGTEEKAGARKRRRRRGGRGRKRSEVATENAARPGTATPPETTTEAGAAASPETTTETATPAGGAGTAPDSNGAPASSPAEPAEAATAPAASAPSTEDTTSAAADTRDRNRSRKSGKKDAPARRSPRRERRPRRGEGAGIANPGQSRVKGMGDHVPAFLQRPLREDD